jgi:hypothetical protein
MSLRSIDLIQQLDTFALGEGLHFTNEVEYISQTNAYRHIGTELDTHACTSSSHYWIYEAFLEHLHHSAYARAAPAPMLFWSLRVLNNPLLHHIRFEAATFACRYDITTLQCFHRYQK